MKSVSINRCLNAGAKLYGLSAFGVITGALLMGLLWLSFSMPISIMATVPGYILGHSVGLLWHKGYLQRKIYWYFPISRLIGGKGLPPSYNRRYM